MNAAPLSIETPELDNTPETVSLATVYDIDLAMGERTRDLMLWKDVTKKAERVIEVGCGNGRILCGLRNAPIFFQGLPTATWVGIDADPEMVTLFRERAKSFLGVLGRAEDPHAWARATSLLAPEWPDVVIIPFSTLYLVPHALQVRVLTLARAAIAEGSRVVVECFVPQPELQQTGRTIQIGGARGPNGESWVRHSTYDIDGASQVTDVVRLYGPTDRFRYRVTERIYWRTVTQLVSLFGEAGLNVDGDSVWTSANRPGLVPEGSIVVVGVRA